MRYLFFLLALLSCAGTLPSSAQSLVTTIPVSGQPYGVAVNATNNRIYVNFSTSIGVIDGNTNTVIDTVQTPWQGSFFIAVNFVTGRVYTAGCSNTGACGVTVMDGSTDAVITTIPIKNGSGLVPQGIAVNPLTNRIYVADDLVSRIVEIDGRTNTVLSYIQAYSSKISGLAVDFSSNQILPVPSDGLLVINGSSHTVSLVEAGTLDYDVAANSFTNRAYVTGSTLSVVDLTSLETIADVPIGSAPFAVCVDYLSNRVFATVMGADGSVVEIDGHTNIVTGTLAVRSDYVDVNPITRLVYASDTNDSSVHVISE
jgi:DNA-binding beta-propeller fold protein YncE